MSQDRRRMSQRKKRKSVHASSTFLSYSRLSKDRMSTHTGRGRSSLPSLIQMLISSGNTLTDTFRNNVLPVVWASLRPVKLTHEMNHQTSIMLVNSRSVLIDKTFLKISVLKMFKPFDPGTIPMSGTSPKDTSQSLSTKISVACF